MEKEKLGNGGQASDGYLSFCQPPPPLRTFLSLPFMMTSRRRPAESLMNRAIRSMTGAVWFELVNRVISGVAGCGACRHYDNHLAWRAHRAARGGARAAVPLKQ
ncbi:hypothetical protein E2C01_002853 [Portunus trituberculatus]|uniref:Uncharacterized protein n=1 Tax=Portunus trituberculatus TaxID=210409 RepID=A0A5B7CN13_PORTR|nr:hypothetical protein [Portunus trituberculatus]